MYPPEEIQLRPNAVDTPATRKDLSGYYAHITALDESLGRLMAALDELGVADDTILVYTSDHGDMLGSHGHVRKERPWEESSRIPFMIRWPRRIPAGVTRETLLSLVDFMPSMLSLCDLPIPEGVEGIDLSEAMLGKTIDEPQSVFLGVPLHGKLKASTSVSVSGVVSERIATLMHAITTAQVGSFTITITTRIN